MIRIYKSYSDNEPLINMLFWGLFIKHSANDHSLMFKSNEGELGCSYIVF